MRKRPAVLSALLLVGFGVTLVPQAVTAQKRNRDKISREELVQSAQKTTDLFQAVRSLRPHMVAPPRGNRTLGGAPPAATQVYIDGNLSGDLEALKLIQTINVAEVEYLEPGRAQDRFGLGASGGAILVTLYKGVPKGTTL